MLKIQAVFLLLFFTVVSVHAQQTADSIKLTKNFILQPPLQLNIPISAVVPANLAIQHLPFFCDKEYKLEKVTKIPFRFRLGSVAYCDKMEGKNQ